MGANIHVSLMPTSYRHIILNRLIRAVHVYSRYRRGNTYTVRALRWFITLSRRLYTDWEMLLVYVRIGSVLFVFAIMFKSRTGFISIAFLWRLLCNLYGILIHTNTWTLTINALFSLRLLSTVLRFIFSRLLLVRVIIQSFLKPFLFFFLYSRIGLH